MLALENTWNELKVKGGLVEIIPKDVDMIRTRYVDTKSRSLINTKNEHYPLADFGNGL
jgi:hypothetical protein